MSNELKIIVGATPLETKVFIGEKQIGLIQEIKFNANANCEGTVTEIVFPDLLSIPSYSDSNGLLKELKESLELLKDMPYVKVTLQKLIFEV